MNISEIDQILKSLSFPVLRIKIYSFIIFFLTILNIFIFSDSVKNITYFVGDDIDVWRLEFSDHHDEIGTTCIFFIFFLFLYHNLSSKVKLITNEINKELLNINVTGQIPFDYRMKINTILLTINKFYLGNKYGPPIYLIINLLVLLFSNLLEYQ